MDHTTPRPSAGRVLSGAAQMSEREGRKFFFFASGVPSGVVPHRWRRPCHRSCVRWVRHRARHCYGDGQWARLSVLYFGSAVRCDSDAFCGREARDPGTRHDVSNRPILLQKSLATLLNNDFVALSRGDFTFDKARNVYICPQGKLLHTTGYVHDGTTLLYRARVSDCGPCPLKPRCCPKTPERKIPRSIHEDARDLARALVGTSRVRAVAPQSQAGRDAICPSRSASYDLAGSDCAARAAHKMSSRSAPSRRTSAALQSWLLDRRQQQSRALRNRSNAHQRPVGEPIMRVRLKRPQREPHD